MNRIQKATAIAAALTISLVGATLVTAPMTLADSQHVVLQAHQWSANHVHHIANGLRHVVSLRV